MHYYLKLLTQKISQGPLLCWDSGFSVRYEFLMIGTGQKSLSIVLLEPFYFVLFTAFAKNKPCKTVFLLLFNYFWLGVFVFFQIPGAPDDEAVRIFLEFERVESAIKGRILNCFL